MLINYCYRSKLNSHRGLQDNVAMSPQRKDSVVTCGNLFIAHCICFRESDFLVSDIF